MAFQSFLLQENQDEFLMAIMICYLSYRGIVGNLRLLSLFVHFGGKHGRKFVNRIFEANVFFCFNLEDLCLGHQCF